MLIAAFGIQLFVWFQSSTLKILLIRLKLDLEIEEASFSNSQYTLFLIMFSFILPLQLLFSPGRVRSCSEQAEMSHDDSNHLSVSFLTHVALIQVLEYGSKQCGELSEVFQQYQCFPFLSILVQLDLGSIVVDRRCSPRA